MLVAGEGQRLDVGLGDRAAELLGAGVEVGGDVPGQDRAGGRDGAVEPGRQDDLLDLVTEARQQAGGPGDGDEAFRREGAGFEGLGGEADPQSTGIAGALLQERALARRGAVGIAELGTADRVEQSGGVADAAGDRMLDVETEKKKKLSSFSHLLFLFLLFWP